jgi:peptide/nickel transport system substrate-binding protein
MARGSRFRALVAVGAVLTLALLAALGALALRVSDEDDPVLPTVSSNYTEAVPGTWQRINPLFAGSNSVDQDMVALVFNGLIRIGEGGAPEPDLAEALPTLGPDGRTYTFVLREGLKWHDGEDVTADDVAFTVRSIQALDFRGDAILSDAWADIEQVTVADRRTVSITLPEPSAPFLARTATLPILPEHLLATFSSQEMEQAAFNTMPVGTGPYRLTSLTSSRAEFAANTSYHLGRPAIERLTLRFYASVDAASSALSAGEADGLFFPDPALVPETLGEDFALLTATRFAYVALYLNNAQAAFFQDETVRRAFSLVVDRAVLSDEAYGGWLLPSASPVTPRTWAYVEGSDGTSVDLAEAEALLDEAGWLRHATTRIRTRSGQEFRITIRTDDDPRRLAVGRLIAAQLDAVGIKATVASTTFAVLRRDFLQERSYEAAIVAWDQGPDPDPYFGWHSSQLGSAGLNLANYSDIESDFVVERGRESSDPGVRLDMYRQFQGIWADTAPSVILGYPQYAYALAGDIGAEVPENLVAPSHRFANIHRWTS